MRLVRWYLWKLVELGGAFEWEENHTHLFTKLCPLFQYMHTAGFTVCYSALSLFSRYPLWYFSLLWRIILILVIVLVIACDGLCQKQTWTSKNSLFLKTRQDSRRQWQDKTIMMQAYMLWNTPQKETDSHITSYYFKHCSPHYLPWQLKSKNVLYCPLK